MAKERESQVKKEEILSGCQEAIGYTFKDKNLLNKALTHPSCASRRLDSFERLEFLGDAVLGMVVCRKLFEEYPEAMEGELTRIKSAVVSRRSCSAVGKALGLQSYLFLGKGIGSRSRLPSSVIAAAFEAVLGAIYLDGGFDAASTFVSTHLSKWIERVFREEHHVNYKSTLQQRVQRDFNTSPVYDTLDVKGPDHSKCFEVCVEVAGKRFPSAWGPNKKEAEQLAAKIALEELEGNPTEEKKSR
jgi:ribonuclease-3